MMTVIVKETLCVDGTIVQVHSAGDQQTVAQDVGNALPYRQVTIECKILN